MSAHFKNFTTVVYIPAWTQRDLTREKLEKDYDFIEKYIGLDKVYLETHRGGIDIEEEKLLMIKDFLQSRGVTVSGGITTTIDDFEGAENGKRRLFNTFCYTDPAMREKLRQISEYTARIFDEVILDDFYFTNCTCERCIKEKGSRSWEQFRHELMMDVSKNLVVGPAKAANPNVKMVIKYPNWRESFHFTGYVPESQGDIFDATYIGTETRHPQYTDQHLPEYLSYSLVRFMENAWPGRCGGGWFDTYQCYSADRYQEQAYLTAFAKAKELMFFQWGDLIDNPYVCAMGLQIGKIDKMMDKTGKPCGIPVYIPHASSGENHLEMRLGMLGLPVEPVPYFPATEPKLLLTGSALADKSIVDKLAAYVEKGGDAVVTTGFFKGAGEELRRRGLTEAHLSGGFVNASRYQVCGDFAGNIRDCAAVAFPEIVHGNNASWSLLNAGEGDEHSSIFLRSTYGKGRLYILAVPEHGSDIYKMPEAAVDVLKRALLCDAHDTYVSGKDISMFTYDDGSIILYRYVKNDACTTRVTMHTSKKVKALKEVGSGREIPVREVMVFEDFERHAEYVADVFTQPGVFNMYRWEE